VPGTLYLPGLRLDRGDSIRETAFVKACAGVRSNGCHGDWNGPEHGTRGQNRAVLEVEK